MSHCLNRVHPKKLLGSHWTSTQPHNKEKHFEIIKVEFDDNQNVVDCIIQAVFTKNEYPINWRDLKNNELWLIGWK